MIWNKAIFYLLYVYKSDNFPYFHSYPLLNTLLVSILQKMVLRVFYHFGIHFNVKCLQNIKLSIKRYQIKKVV